MRSWQGVLENVLAAYQAQGLAAEAADTRANLQWLADIETIMRIQVQAIHDEGAVPLSDRLLPDLARREEVVDV